MCLNLIYAAYCHPPSLPQPCIVRPITLLPLNNITLFTHLSLPSTTSHACLLFLCQSTVKLKCHLPLQNLDLCGPMLSLSFADLKFSLCVKSVRSITSTSGSDEQFC